MKVIIKKGTLFIRLPLIDPIKLSSTGKSLLVASSRGPRRTALTVGKKPLIVSAMAYVRSDEYLRAKRIAEKRHARRERVRRQRRSKDTKSSS
jgi:hypothetical protein